MQEFWVDIPGFEGYQVSNFGRLRSFKTLGCRAVINSNNAKNIKVFIRSLYPVVVLRKKGERKSYTFHVHRLVWELFVGPIPEKMQVDHIDKIKTNNALCNLRLVTPAQNSMNCFARKNRKFKGVKKSRNKWSAQIQVNKLPIYLGVFNTEIEAARAYNIAAEKYYGEFAHLNVID